MGKTLRSAIRAHDSTDEILARIKRAKPMALCGMLCESIWSKSDVRVPIEILKRGKGSIYLMHELALPQYFPLVKTLSIENLGEVVTYKQGPKTLEEYMRLRNASPAQIAYASIHWRSLCYLAAAVDIPLDLVHRIWLTP